MIIMHDTMLERDFEYLYITSQQSMYLQISIGSKFAYGNYKQQQDNKKLLSDFQFIHKY